MKFDEELEFDQDKYVYNIARHTFPGPDEKDGKGVVE